ncbi:MAG: hypothetical protein ACKVPY_17020 [Paracoccaceae bacterium]
MTNRLSIALGLIIAAALALDGIVNGFAASLFLARKLFAFLDYLAFWR